MYECVLYLLGDIGIGEVGAGQFSKVFAPVRFLSWEDFKHGIIAYVRLLIDGENFTLWLEKLGVKSLKIVIVVACIYVLMRVLYKFIEWRYGKVNTKHGAETLPLRVYHFFARWMFLPMKYMVLRYIGFLSVYTFVWKWIWIPILFAHFNLLSIIVGVIGGAFYFILSGDLLNIFVQLYKVVLDLQVVWWTPLPFILPVAWYLFERMRTRIGYERMRHFEACNCGFIRSLGIGNMLDGVMSKGKTLIMADMMRSQELIYRQDALDVMIKHDMRFPNFPWVLFEDEIRERIELDLLFNLAGIHVWLEEVKEAFCDGKHGLWGYDFERYGMYFQRGAYEEDLFEVMETYARSYFVYITSSSLMISTFSVLSGVEMASVGNLPMWFSTFFQEKRGPSRYSHILDCDLMRLGKKMIENNVNAGYLEFGVIGMPEVGKERLNALELREVKKDAREANQKNDLFNFWVKMVRHFSTIDYKTFIKLFFDEQRAESLGADARELCDLLHVGEKGPEECCLPFYTLEDMISEYIYLRFKAFYTQMRFLRGDTTLLIYLAKQIVSWIDARRTRYHDRFCYEVYPIERESGRMDGVRIKKKYIVMAMKAKQAVYCTDSYSEFFSEQALNTQVSFDNIPTYKSIKATAEELRSQNSYFINSMIGGK